MGYFQKVTGGASKKISAKYNTGQQNGEMPFNINKCQILQVISRNIKNEYEMCGVNIKSVHSVKDPGVTITTNLMFSQQCNEPVKDTNRMMCLIEKLFIQE